MTQYTYWLIEGAVIYQKGVGHIKLEDLELARERVQKLVDTATRPVHIINDASETLSLPQDLSQIKRIVTSDQRNHNIGWIVSISVRRIDSVILQFIGMMTHTRMTHFLKLEDALSFLNRQDPTLPPLNISMITDGDLVEIR